MGHSELQSSSVTAKEMETALSYSISSEIERDRIMFPGLQRREEEREERRRGGGGGSCFTVENKNDIN